MVKMISASSGGAASGHAARVVVTLPPRNCGAVVSVGRVSTSPFVASAAAAAGVKGAAAAVASVVGVGVSAVGTGCSADMVSRGCCNEEQQDANKKRTTATIVLDHRGSMCCLRDLHTMSARSEQRGGARERFSRQKSV